MRRPALIIVRLSLLALLLQLARGQKELAGAFIEGNDWCPEAAKQQKAATQQPLATQQRSSSSSTLGRLFSSSSSRRQAEAGAAAAAAAKAPACKLPFKYCGSLQSVVERCRTTFGCKAVSFDGKCGLLKTADKPRRARPGWSTYVVG